MKKAIFENFPTILINDMEIRLAHVSSTIMTITNWAAYKEGVALIDFHDTQESHPGVEMSLGSSDDRLVIKSKGGEIVLVLDEDTIHEFPESLLTIIGYYK